MKKFLILAIFSTITFSNFLTEKFSARVYVENKEYAINYTPKRIKVEVLAPKLNKGEIYTYEKGKKYVYYPKFKKIVEQTISNSNNDIFKMLEEMRKINKTTKIGKRIYNVKNGNIVSVVEGEYRADISYIGNKPSKIVIKEGNRKVEILWKY